MIKNPEIQRKIWTDFTLHRVLALPLALALFFFALYYSGEEFVRERTLSIASLSVFGILNVLGGAILAARSITNEVNERTWDYQKLSAQTPWALLFGKLFGSTLYVWYASALAYVIAVASLHKTFETDKWIGASFLLIFSALTSHVIGLIAGIDSIRHETDLNRKKVQPSTVYVLLYMIILNTCIPALSAIGGTGVKWYDMEMHNVYFFLMSEICLLVWLLFSSHEKIREQFRMKTWPWLTLVSPLILSLYLHGIHVPRLVPSEFQDTAATFQGLTYGLFLLSLYFHLFTDPWSGINYRRIASLYAAKKYSDIIHIVPHWILLLPCALIFLVALLYTEAFAVTNKIQIALFLFALRDVFLLHVFKLSPKAKWPIRSTLFYMFCLYFFLPFLARAFSAPLDTVSLFLPSNKDISIISGLLQVLLLALLTVRQWHKNWVDVK